MVENLDLKNRIDPDQTFVALGMDSINAMTLVGDLEDHLSRRLSPTLAWDHPTPGTLAAHLEHEGPASEAGESEGDILNRLDELSEAEVDRLLAERLGRKNPE
jgi:acyl carrier protein